MSVNLQGNNFYFISLSFSFKHFFINFDFRNFLVYYYYYKTMLYDDPYSIVTSI